METTEQLTVDELIERYTQEGRAEFAADEARRAAERERLHAAFEAGAPLVVKKPLEIWDPIDQAAVRITSGTILTVAEHEGDILIGQLSDNSHSIGVLHEEAHRWYTRKYFLPLLLLCDPVYIGTGDEEAVHGGQIKGLENTGTDRGTALAIKRLETLALKDDAAVIPRGVRLILRDGAEGHDPESGAAIILAPGSVAEVVQAVGDTGDPSEDDFPDIPVRVDGQRVDLPFEVLRDLDMKADVLTLREQEQAQAQARAQTLSRRRWFGVGLATACLALDGVLLAQSKDAIDRGMLISAIVSELGLVYGYFSAGGAYWHELQGLALDLAQGGYLGSVRTLEHRLDEIGAESDALWSIYSDTYYRSVHTRWIETRHYRTDDKGNRTYTHSTWHKGYSTLWVEPPALAGTHSIIGAWANGDEHRRVRCDRLADERIFNLLDADREDAERSFDLNKIEVGFASDAAKSALSAALIALPATFYDHIFEALTDRQPGMLARRQLFTQQKGILHLAGAVVGIVQAERSRKQHSEALAANRYEIGHQLEDQIKRVPTLSFPEAWVEFFGEPAPNVLPAKIRARGTMIAKVTSQATSFTYTHGSGWDSGRRLDSIHIDSGPVKRAFEQRNTVFTPLAAKLEAVLRSSAHAERLLTVLRNAVGTEVLDQMADTHQDEAEGGSLRRGLWFNAPIWGMSVLDLLFKAL